MDDDDDVDARKGDLLARHAAQLLEHFDTVRIFVTWSGRDSDGDAVTKANDRGGGNYYAQAGQVREWLVRQDHRARCAAEREDDDS